MSADDLGNVFSSRVLRIKCPSLPEFAAASSDRLRLPD
jgi:hypothetical protein